MKNKTIGKIKTTDEAIKRLNDMIREAFKDGYPELADQLDEIRQFLGRDL